jgi:tetratricopeptide (TPR) repeat protein
VTASRAAVARHLDAATLGSLGARERSLLVHVATCTGCRRRLAAEARDLELAWTPDAAADAAILRLLRDLERETNLDDRLAAIEREHLAAPELVRELLEHPDSWGTAASEPRYASLEVAWHLLVAAKGEEPLLALRLIDLAGEIAVVLAAADSRAHLHRQLLVEVRCARAHRRLDAADRAGAGRELRRAASQLAPDLGYARALYCLALARLRRQERRWEEALAIGERAVMLLDDHGTTLEAGQAQIEQGWALIDAGDPDEALPLLEAALPLVEGMAAWAVSGRLGLAVALAAQGDWGSASQLLAAADRLTAQVVEPRMRQRLRWRGAQAARRCGQGGSAFRRLCRAVTGLLALGEDRDAAQALCELLALCLDHQWHRVFRSPSVQLALDALRDSPHLHRRARNVIGLVAYVVLDPERRCAAEVVANASRYLVDSRNRPDQTFRPTRPKIPPIHHTWDALDPRLRGDICVEVGIPEETGRRSGEELETSLREVISWRFEVLRRVRIGFAPKGRRPLPAP